MSMQACGTGTVTRVRRVLAGTALAVVAGILVDPPPSDAAPTVAAGTPAARPDVVRADVVRADAPRADAPRLGLPAPTGRHPVGTTSLHLVDPTRTDPLAPKARPRELMVRLWYPAAPGREPLAAYQTPRASAIYAGYLNFVNGTDYPPDLLAFPSHSRQDAPATGRRRPVVLFSPDGTSNAVDATGLHEELASRGYVVAGIDHTFDAGVVEFPGGRVEIGRSDLAAEVIREVRVADARFVLDSLAAVAAGHDPDAGHRDLPRGLGRALDLTRVAAYGHGLGSRTVVEALARDRRVDAGVVLNGDPLGPASLDRPLLMMGDQRHRRANAPEWAAFHDRLRGRRLHLVLDGAGHDDLTDIAVFKSGIRTEAFFVTGPIDGVRALAVERAYVTAWLDRVLRGRPSPLLRGESRRYPEVDFQP